MKFKFCGDQDCPEWILQEIAVVSKLSSVRVRLLTKQLILNMLDSRANPLEYEKLERYTTSTRMSYTEEEVKAIMNTLYFVLYNSSRHDVSAEVLYPELEQLGLPSDIAKSFTKMFIEYQQPLQQALAKQTLKLSTLNTIEWRVNYILDSSLDAADGKGSVGQRVEARLALSIDKNHTTTATTQQKNDVVIFDASLEAIDLLLHELKECRNIVQRIKQ